MTLVEKEHFSNRKERTREALKSYVGKTINVIAFVAEVGDNYALLSPVFIKNGQIELDHVHVPSSKKLHKSAQHFISFAGHVTQYQAHLVRKFPNQFHKNKKYLNLKSEETRYGFDLLNDLTIKAKLPKLEQQYQQRLCQTQTKWLQEIMTVVTKQTEFSNTEKDNLQKFFLKRSFTERTHLLCQLRKKLVTNKKTLIDEDLLQKDAQLKQQANQLAYVKKQNKELAQKVQQEKAVQQKLTHEVNQLKAQKRRLQLKRFTPKWGKLTQTFKRTAKPEDLQKLKQHFK